MGRFLANTRSAPGLQSQGDMLRRSAFLAVVAIVAFAPACAAPTEGDDVGEDDGIDVTSEDVERTADALVGFDKAVEDAQARNINARRAAIERTALIRRPCLDKVARRWSQELAKGAVLKHNPKFASDVTDSCKASGLTWKALAENVGRAYTEPSMWKGFMGSPGHRANIEYASADSFGVGAYRKADGTFFVTHLFADF
jgi:uncharacterized protein YkwD